MKILLGAGVHRRMFGLDNYDVSGLIGRTVTAITYGSAALATGAASATFTLDDGSHLRMWHDQDCCEDVSLADIVGDLQDIIGSPLIMAEESSSAERPEDASAPEFEPESQTWTFYKFATVKGYVTLRWLGTSNGYYSERMSCELIPAAQA